ncbi:MAG: GNAT family N-acetyltransferase [Clostridiales bacterium]|nr:GNAT family N-acetyltransferase [Clostridiales bacterium]
MTIKIVRTSDTDLLATLNHDVQEIHHNIEPEIFKPYNKENMKRLFDDALENENASAYIAYFDDEVAGYMLLNKRYSEANCFKKSYSALLIDQICVESHFKGKGIGKALVEFEKAYAKDFDISRIEMNYWTKNNNSGEFFRSQGFENYNERLAIKI